ncbi:RdRP-domain-containing protein [Ascobolus immersus RN42]|uniref:RdRP-domain-containing protein n=1 Tax=Ascobolus immersus RN42 TaxID=1160509 RepID=A0A3N4I7P7_ASCIM|nr:RdRP-domain-containing protein [Ascobolus immersus RN42]
MAKFKITLPAFHPDDKEWSFLIPNLPKEPQTGLSGYIKTITAISTRTTQSLELRYEKAPDNRVIDKTEVHKYLLISFANFRLQLPPKITGDPNAPPITETEQASAKDSGDYIVRILRAGVKINGIVYNFLGHSSSQLKSKTTFLYAAPKGVITQKIEGLGEFGSIKTVAKKAKRIGLLFTSGEVSCELDSKHVEEIPDIQTKDFCFTDGCGFISLEFARLLAKKKKIIFRDKRYLPSVFQIRYRGYKGVLMVEPQLKPPVWAQFRSDSMRKFKTLSGDNSFVAVAYSKPYAFGYLNDELVTLIHAIGVPAEAFIKKQQEHFDFLERALVDPVDAFRFLSYTNQTALAEKLILEGLDAVKPSIGSSVNKAFEKMLGKREQQRCRIMVRKSRVIFGVADSRGILKEGECFVRITSEESGIPVTIHSGPVLVGRNPALHPGDVRKLRAVNRPELNHLVDCIVFPTQGKRPTADLMSGGDLDGDAFFVCWDPEVMPNFVAQPAEYPGGREPVKFEKITDDDRLEFFARYTNASLGRVKNLYLDWARVKGAMSDECQELNRLFSLCVDGNRIRVPQKLESPPQPTAETPPFILDVLHTHAINYVQNRPASRKELMRQPTLGVDSIEILLSQDNLALSEFEALQMAYNWCARNCTHIMELLLFFDFTRMSTVEKAWILDKLPPTMDGTSLITNALLQSYLLTPEELAPYKLHYPAMRWKRVFSSEVNHMRLLFDQINRTFPLFHRKLLVLRVDERLTVAIYIQQQIEPSTEGQVDDTARLFAFTHTRDGSNMHRLAVPTKKNYRLYFDNSGFQLYEGKRANTFVFLNRAQQDTERYRNIPGKADRIRGKQTTLDDGTNHNWVASIALQKFSNNLARNIGRVNRNGVLGAELYVISNRDIKSLELLDLWLEQIDTEEVIPLFEKKAREFTIPHISDVDWGNESQNLRQLIGKQDYTTLDKMSTIPEFLEAFDWLLARDERDILHRCYSYLISNMGRPGPYTRHRVEGFETELLYVMLKKLQEAPYLALSLSSIFKDSHNGVDIEQLVDFDIDNFRNGVANALIRCADTMQELMYEPLKNTLKGAGSNGHDISLLVRSVCLAVQSPELALDILLEILEPVFIEKFPGHPNALEHLIRSLFGITLDHIDETKEAKKKVPYLISLRPDHGESTTYGGHLVRASMRLDAPIDGKPRFGDHVKLVVAGQPANNPLKRRFVMSAIVDKAFDGTAVFECFQTPPPYMEDCSWRLVNFGSFVTARCMFDAVNKLHTEKNECCPVYDILLGLPPPPQRPARQPHPDDWLWKEEKKEVFKPIPSLNPSQNAAVEAALSARLTCLWGPPGTGKTSTVVEILIHLLTLYPRGRILMTAPTHNAVDNVMSKFLKLYKPPTSASDDNPVLPANPLRVSTDIRKVDNALKNHTIDALMGFDLTQRPELKKKALAQITASRIIFTTCIGSGLGLLANETFDIVIVDEASQQTEPSSLVPMVKFRPGGEGKVILVGDHVQLRATVRTHSQTQNYQRSLFERLYTTTTPEMQTYEQRGDFAKVMLDTQYRMHSTLCHFPSQEFYSGKLHTGPGIDTSRGTGFGGFTPSWLGKKDGRLCFVTCEEPEEAFTKSKCNKAQAELCAQICKLLLSSPSSDGDNTIQKPSITILTPYTAQLSLLSRLVPKEATVATIDSYQGREADIVIFCTVRCNTYRQIGFLTDGRRLNVAFTRARCGMIVVGSEVTLGGREGRIMVREEGEEEPEQKAEEDGEGVWRRFVGLEGLEKISAEAFGGGTEKPAG